MSDASVFAILGRFEGAAFIAPQHAGLLNDLQRLASAPAFPDAASTLARCGELCDAYGFSRPTVQEKPYAYVDGIAIIPVHGTLINRFSYSYSFATGYNFIRRLMNAAVDDDDVKLIVLDINSYGGEAAGCFELAEEIAELRSQKSILAVVDSNCCSAAYAIATGASKIVVTPSGQAGSIGVVCVHTSIEKALADMGVKVTIIAEMDHKADGNPYQDLPEDVQADFQASVKKRADEFITLVAKNRNLGEESIRATQSRVYRADEALSRGLIDLVATPTKAVAAFLGELGDEEPADEEDEEMSTATPQTGAAAPQTQATPTPAAAAPAVDQAAITAAAADAVAHAMTAERTRTNAILTCEAAKDKPKLAQTLVMQGLSAETATTILAAAAPETKAAAGGEGGGKSAFQARMDAEGGAGVSAEGGQEGGEGGEGENGKPPPSARAKGVLDQAFGPEKKERV
jgi:signal peptide peptidase SppA